ncbi:hypothetical protein MNV49_004639 [Pseudohyphozyma bogoriensis]|nr:hypothetical protein MNV49_004639 [Pseudohyphozyma bogoriensis]
MDLKAHGSRLPMILDRLVSPKSDYTQVATDDDASPLRQHGGARPRLARPLLAVTALCVLATVLLLPYKHQKVKDSSGPELPASPRAFYSGCPSTAFLQSIRDSHPSGTDFPSAHLLPSSPDFSYDPTSTRFSFALTGEHGCVAPLHVFSGEDACEVLGAFGGMFVIGDSFVRHMWSALLMILRGRTDGAWEGFGAEKVVTGGEEGDDQKLCEGEHVFTDQSPYCRSRVLLDLSKAVEPVCGGRVQGGCFNTARPDDLAYSQVEPFLSAMTQQSKPSILLQGYGLHYNYNISGNLDWHHRINAFTRQHPHPRLVNLWAGVHGADVDKMPAWARKTQGPEKAREYNVALWKQTEEVLDERGWVVDYFNVTQGAFHFDGVHVSMQANMEKVQILLNYLSLVQQEIQAAGGEWK